MRFLHDISSIFPPGYPHSLTREECVRRCRSFAEEDCRSIEDIADWLRHEDDPLRRRALAEVFGTYAQQHINYPDQLEAVQQLLHEVIAHATEEQEVSALEEADTVSISRTEYDELKNYKQKYYRLMEENASNPNIIVYGNYIAHQEIETQINNFGKDADEETSESQSHTHPSFEDAIPAHLRSGLLLNAWNGLCDAGILTDDYRLADGVSKAAAHFMVECFCRNKKQNEWLPFEKFWNLTDLRRAVYDFSKEQEEKISKVFREL